MTKVVFRKFKDDGEIIALFPEEPWNPDKGTIVSYMHTGQHGDADYHHVLAKTRPAREDEYRPLLAELKRVGYNCLNDFPDDHRPE
jgi:hypothetical protein